MFVLVLSERADSSTHQNIQAAALGCMCGWTAGFSHRIPSLKVLEDFSWDYRQESNMNRENMVTQLLHLQSCPLGDAHRASAADWPGQSATCEKQEHFFTPTQFIKKMRLVMRFQVIHIITLFAGLQQYQSNNCLSLYSCWCELLCCQTPCSEQEKLFCLYFAM